ncbi:hypothetical protein AB2843_000346 [Klebsiella pneumoniae]|nr:hypothetical protein [Klebsiella pneumoniae]
MNLCKVLIDIWQLHGDGAGLQPGDALAQCCVIVEQLTDVAILLANAIFAFSRLLLRLLQRLLCGCARYGDLMKP